MLFSHPPPPNTHSNDGGSPTGLCVLLGAWGGPVATIEAPCHDCLQACQLHSECVSLVHNGVDIAREGTSCVSGTRCGGGCRGVWVGDWGSILHTYRYRHTNTYTYIHTTPTATPGAPPTVRAQPRALTTNSDFFTNQEDQEDDNPFLWAAQQLPLPPRSPIGAPPPGRGPLAMPSVTPAPSRSPAHDSSSRLTTSAVISALYYGRTGVYGAPVGRMQPYAQGGGYVRGAPVPMPVYGAPVYASPAAGGYAAPYRGAMPPMVGGAPASYQSQVRVYVGGCMAGLSMFCTTLYDAHLCTVIP